MERLKNDLNRQDCFMVGRAVFGGHTSSVLKSSGGEQRGDLHLKHCDVHSCTDGVIREGMFSGARNHRDGDEWEVQLVAKSTRLEGRSGFMAVDFLMIAVGETG